MSIGTQAADTFRPPELSGNHSVRQASTSAAAAEVALGTPTGKYYVTFQAVTTDVYVALKLGTSAATVTTTLGVLIPAGQSVSWWVESNRINYLEHITASGSGTLKWWVSSPLYERPALGGGS